MILRTKPINNAIYDRIPRARRSEEPRVTQFVIGVSGVRLLLSLVDHDILHVVKIGKVVYLGRVQNMLDRSVKCGGYGALYSGALVELA